MQKRAAQDKIKAENVRKKDSIMQRNANAKGTDLASYKNQARANAKGYNQLEGTESLDDTRKSDIKCTSKKSCGIAKEAARAEKSATYQKNGGRINPKIKKK